MAGLLIFLHGPFDVADQRNPKQDDLKQRVELAHAELDALETRKDTLKQQIPWEKRRADEIRRTLTRLNARRKVLVRLDAELAELQKARGKQPSSAPWPRYERRQEKEDFPRN